MLIGRDGISKRRPDTGGTDSHASPGIRKSAREDPGRDRRDELHDLRKIYDEVTVDDIQEAWAEATMVAN
jgi:hypothetical protein